MIKKRLSFYLQIMFIVIFNTTIKAQTEKGTIAVGFKQGLIFSKPFSSNNINIHEFNQNSSSYNFSLFYLWANQNNTRLHSGQIGFFNRTLKLKQDTLNILTTESIIDAKFSVGKRIAIQNTPICFDYYVALTFKTLLNKKYYTDKSFSFDNYPQPGKSMMYNIGIAPELNLNCKISDKATFFFNQGFQMDILRIGKAYKSVSTLFFDYSVNCGIWIVIE